MNVQLFIDDYVKKFIKILDDFVRINIDTLRGKDLADFYDRLLVNLRKTFGGAWGFNGVTEFLVLRTLYHLGIKKFAEKPKPVPITNDINGFIYSNAGIVLSAGRPLALINQKRIWPDIVVYRPGNSVHQVEKLISVLEVKAYPPSIKEIDENVIKRFEEVRQIYGEANFALIVYIYNSKSSNTKMLRYLRGDRVDGKRIPRYVNTIILSRDNRPISEILGNYL